MRHVMPATVTGVELVESQSQQRHAAATTTAANSGSKLQRRPRTRLQRPRKEKVNVDVDVNVNVNVDSGTSLSSPEQTSGRSTHYQFPADDADLTRLTRGPCIQDHVYEKNPYICTNPGSSHSLNSKQAIFTTDHSLVSPDSHSLEMMDLNIQLLRRTRAKTPCFFVGQLEEVSAAYSSNGRAGKLQAELPLRTHSPYNPVPPKTLPRTVRKVKGRESLRETVKPDRHYSFDAETLVGTESPGSQASPSSSIFPSEFSGQFQEPVKYEDAPPQQLEEDHDIGLRICLDMLTNELATALFKQHPAENLDRASGLQIMLLIEAYESVQQRIRQDMHQLNIASSNPNHVMAAEQMLDHWIDALYALHDQSEARKANNLKPHTSVSHRQSLSKLRRKASTLDGSDTFFDCVELDASPPSYTQFH